MANAENRNFAEKTGDFFKRLGLVGGVIGLIAMIAEAPLGGTLFYGGIVVAGGGFVMEKAAGKKR